MTYINTGIPQQTALSGGISFITH